MMPAWSTDDPLWCLMTKTESGAVSLLKHLTLREATKAYERLSPFYGRSFTERVYVERNEKDRIVGIHYLNQATVTRFGSGADIVQKEIIGPKGWDGKLVDAEAWPKTKTIFVDADNVALDPQPDWSVRDLLERMA